MFFFDLRISLKSLWQVGLHGVQLACFFCVPKVSGTWFSAERIRCSCELETVILVGLSVGAPWEPIVLTTLNLKDSYTICHKKHAHFLSVSMDILFPALWYCWWCKKFRYFRRVFIRIPGEIFGISEPSTVPTILSFVTSLVMFGRGLSTGEERTNCSNMMRRIASNLKQRLQGSLRHCVIALPITDAIMDHYGMFTLLGTKISPPKGTVEDDLPFPRKDMLVFWRVPTWMVDFLWDQCS